MKNVIFGICLATLMTACGQNSKSGPLAAIGQGAQTLELQGKKFESETCKTPILMRLFSAKGYRARIRFIGNQIVRKTVYFANTDCSGPEIMTFVETGTFERKSEAAPEKATAIDIHYDKLQAKVDTDEGKQFAEKDLMGACGRSTWNINELVDVTAQSGNMNCFMRKVPYDMKDIYRLDGTKLVTGHGYNEYNVSERPNKLKMDEGYRSI